MRDIKLNSIEFVLATIDENFKNTFKLTEHVDILDSYGRVVAEDIISDVVIPEFPKSTVDGYAIKNSVNPKTLHLVGKIEIGNVNFYELKKDECVYVPTGGMIPIGTEAMVKIEETTKIDLDHVKFDKSYESLENIISIGDDLKKGDILISKGKTISAFDIGAFASVGLDKIHVMKKPSVSIISTGDELVESNKKITLGQVRDINTSALSALSREYGLEVIKTYVVKDDYKKLEKILNEAIEISDIVLVSGGSSVGDRDYTYDLINSLGNPGVLTDGMALKPGKPTIVGKVKEKPIIGLPGHPVSAIMVFKIVMKQLLATWGFSQKKEFYELAKLTKSIYSAKGRDTYQMVSIGDDDGNRYAIPTSGKSGMITLLTGSDGYVIIPKETDSIEKGETVKCFYF